MDPPANRDGFEIAVICALPEERDTVEAVMTRDYASEGRRYGKVQRDDNSYTLGELGGKPIVLVTPRDMGTMNTRETAVNLLHSFPQIALALVVGIAGGAPFTYKSGARERSDIQLGDVIISTQVIAYDFGKEYDNTFEPRTDVEAVLPRAPAAITNFLNLLLTGKSRQFKRVLEKTNVDLADIMELDSNEIKDYDRPDSGTDRVYASHYRHKHHDVNICETCKDCTDWHHAVCPKSRTASCEDLGCEPLDINPERKTKIHFGRVASGNAVMKSAHRRDSLIEKEKCIGFEMEGAGTWELIGTIVIKGVVDYADSHKNKKWRLYPAARAAICAKAIIEEIELPDRPHAEPDHLRDTTLLGKLQGAIDAGSLPIAAGAAFDMYSRDDDKVTGFTDLLQDDDRPGTCLANTRVELQRQIAAWAEDSQGKCLFCLQGQAGMGKSTFARTVAYDCKAKGQLAASFFFKQGESDRSNAKRLYTTIASQLARSIPESLEPLLKQLRDEPDTWQKRPKEQFEKLVLYPAECIQNKIKPSLSLVIIIDALDECSPQEDAVDIIRQLARLSNLKNLSFRILITSRPNTHINSGLRIIGSRIHEGFHMQDLTEEVTRRDILTYLRHVIAVIRERPQDPVPTNWPGNEAINELTEMALPLFIYAATLCRFISDELEDPRSQLEYVLKYHQFSSGLDRIYRPVLESLIVRRSDKTAATQQISEIVGAIVLLADPLPIIPLAMLLGKEPRDLRPKLDGLRSVLVIPTDNNHPIRPIHLSFRDFLTNDGVNEPHPFQVDKVKMHSNLAQRCVALLSESGRLGKDICKLSKPGIRRSEVNAQTVEAMIKPEVQYACCHWVYHLKKSKQRIDDDDIFHTFLVQKFIFWIEALAWMGKSYECIHMVATLRARLAESNSDKMSLFLDDAKRFLLYFQSCIDAAPLQLYASCLIFAPTRSILRECFEKYGPEWMSLYPEVLPEWSQELQKLEGHKGGVRCVAFSPNGKVLASGGSEDQTIRLWDPATGKLIQELMGHRYSVHDLAFSRDGEMLVSASDDRTVRVWDVKTGWEIEKLKNCDDIVEAVEFSHDGHLLASGSNHGMIRVWDMAKNWQAVEFEAHHGRITALAFSPNGNVLASASSDHTVKLWDTKKTRPHIQQIRKFEGHNWCVCAVAFSINGEVLVSASFDQTIRVWDPSTGEQLKIISGHDDFVTGVAFSPDGKLLASASHDRTLRLWDPVTWRCIEKLEGHIDFVMAVAFSSDKSLLASASLDRTVRLWDWTEDREIQKRNGHSEGVTAVTFSPDGYVLASASYDSSIIMWHGTTGEKMRTLNGHKDRVLDIAFSPDKNVLASASSDKTVILWHWTTGEMMWKLEGHEDRVCNVAFLGRGKLLASTSDDNTIKLWDWSTGTEIRTLQGHSECITNVASSLDGNLLASASKDGTIRVWDPMKGTEMLQLPLDPHLILRQMSFTNNGDHLETIVAELFDGVKYLKTTYFPFGSHASIAPSKCEPLDPGSFPVHDHWIKRKDEDLLWLPYEYRGRYSTTLHGNMLAIGQPCGAVSFFGFDERLEL